MKKFKIAIISLGLISTMFLSCTNTDTEDWRDKNLAFYDGLKNKPGVLEIGDSINGYPKLYYTVYENGTAGTKPVYGNKVKVTYAGWLWNDTTKYNSPLNLKNAFDYSTTGTTFKIGNALIEGFNIALTHMNYGARWRIYVPYYLAYGRTGSNSIKAYSTLIYDVRLVSLESEN